MAAFAGLSGCGSAELFRTYDLPESPEVADAAWPRLVDTPAAPAVGETGPGVPDPASGAQIQRDLADAAAVAEIRRAALDGPVITDDERGAMLARARAPRP